MTHPAWHLFIYRLPASPSRARVGVWRELRRLGALQLQQAVSAFPDCGDIAAALDAVEERVGSEGGTVYRFLLDNLNDRQQAQLRAEWTALREHEYAELIEECETKFRREVEFEIFRNNLTGSEAEEIEADLEKIHAWFQRISARDWFGAANRPAAEAALTDCQRLLDDFVERVFLAEVDAGQSTALPAPLSWDPPRRAQGEDNLTPSDAVPPARAIS
ncbi:MAG: hypothetical protein DCC58_13720 [Chloroflexi bacterium]|nr:MAG: hypothetical protein DCC58_13720 [Chloroflexota bacterium]